MQLCETALGALLGREAAGLARPTLDRAPAPDGRASELAEWLWEARRVVAFDPRNDVAVLRVPGLEGEPLALADPAEGTAVAILGYPESGPFTATAGRIGQTGSVLTDDAYGREPISRRITTLRGVVRQGNSGGPAVDSAGRVRTTIFAARIGSVAGYGVPTGIVRNALAGAGQAEVSTGPCVR